ncbi:hypothetical protein Tco_1461074, partial [Tanacetum coccineum]
MTTGFLTKLITKNCHLLTTRTVDDAPGLKAFKVPNQNLLITKRTVDDAPGLKAFKVPNQNLLITKRTVDDEVAPGLLTFKVPGKQAEMTLESRLGSLIQQDTITQLKSAALREPGITALGLGSLIQQDTITQLKSAALREPAITSLKEQVRALQELDILGWSGKNVQVQQQVIDVISHIASTATKFPKISIAGICERVPALKTRAQAMKYLPTFSEAMGI